MTRARVVTATVLLALFGALSHAAPPAGAAATPPEVCNGIDDDGDGFVDEGVPAQFSLDNDNDGYGTQFTVMGSSCSPGPGLDDDNLDLQDSNPQAHPGAFEICNNSDDDFNGQIDDGARTIWFIDSDHDGF